MNSKYNFPGLTAEQFNIILDCFPSNTKLIFFGSRIKSTHREYSDLDICVLSPLSRKDMAIATEKLEESNLPFTVDVVLYSDCTSEFKNIIDSTGILIE